MGHECSQGSCCSHEHHSSLKNESECSHSGCCGDEHHHHKYADELLHLADEAWMCLLKEKIKDEIRLNAGDQLSHLAKLVSTANHARWKDKMQSKKDYEDFECQLKSVLCCKSQK